MSMSEKEFSRKGFLKGAGALVVTLAAPGSLLANSVSLVQADNSYASPDASQLDSYLSVNADGTVTMFTGKVELGMGAILGLSQIVAEELDVPINAVSVVSGDTTRTVDQGPTYGSRTIAAAGPQMRQAAADARYVLMQMAAQTLGTTPDKLSVSNGTVSVSGAPTKSITYASLIGGKSFNTSVNAKGTGLGMVINGQGTPKDPSQYKIVGQSIVRPDIPEKVAATFTFAQDVKITGMLHGRVIRPSGIGSTLVSVGTAPKGVKIVRKGNFLGVVAKDEWTAIKAAQSLKVKWTTWNGLPTTSELHTALRQSKTTEKLFASGGDVAAALTGAAKTLKATYNTPMETHGSLGPSVAIADVSSDGSAVVYSGTQEPHAVRASIAQYLGVDQTKVKVVYYEAAGCYGRNGADPAALDAVIMSQALGAPVRVQWMRWDEHGWDPKSPPTTQDLVGGLDASGNVVAWNHELWNPPTGSTMLIGTFYAGNPVGVLGVGGWTGPLLYKFPNFQQLAHGEADMGTVDATSPGIISAWMRTPTQYQVTFAMEAFMDELAAAAGQDPIQFRLKYLTDQRMIDLLNAVAQRAAWQTRPSPSGQAQSKSQVVKGRGVGITLRDGTYDAGIAEVSVDKKTGKVTVDNFYIGQDNGLTINPRAVELTMETCVTQTVSRALFEEMTTSTHNVTALNWQQYPILRFMDTPKVHPFIINRPTLKATGSGEPSASTVACAISNAIFDATGVRIRDLPFRSDRVKAALKAAAAD